MAGAGDPEGEHAFLKTTICLPSGPTSGAEHQLPALTGRIFAYHLSASELLLSFLPVDRFLTGPLEGE